MRFVGFLILVIGALLLAAVTLPYWFDVNRHKPTIAATFESVTGHRVVIDGPVTISLLPQPSLTVERLRLPAPNGAGFPDLLSIARLTMAITPQAFLAGRVEIGRMAVSGVRLTLQILRDGTPNWLVPPMVAGAAAGAPIRLDDIVLNDGTVTYVDGKGDAVWSVSGLTGRARADSAQGPFAFRGSGRIAGWPAALDLSLGRNDGTDLAMTLLADLGTGSGQSRFVGAIESWRDKPMIRGQITAEAPHLERFVPGLEGAATLAGQIAAGSGGVELGDARATVAEFTATGGGAYQPGDRPRAALNLRIAQLDLDRLVDRLAAVPLPTGWISDAATGKSGIDLALELQIAAATRAGGIMRQLLLRAGIDRDGIEIVQAAAFLPGGTEAGLKGRIARRGDKPGFDGEGEFTTDNARQLLSWLGFGVEAVPADRLRSAWAKAHLKSDGEVVEFSNLTFAFDATNGQGAAAAALSRRPSFSLDLSLDRINLEAYWPRGGGDADAGWLSGYDTNSKITCDRIDWGEIPGSDFSFDLSVIDGALPRLQIAVGDLAGASLTLTAKAAPATGGRFDYDVNLSGSGPDYARLVRALAAGEASPLERPVQGPFAIDSRAAGQAADAGAVWRALAQGATVQPR